MSVQNTTIITTIHKLYIYIISYYSYIHTWGITPISSRRGPKMNPPPEPSRPPTQPPNRPQAAQNVMWPAVQWIVASHTVSVFPRNTLLLSSLYSFTDSYPNTASAIGSCTHPWRQFRNDRYLMLEMGRNDSSCRSLKMKESVVIKERKERGLRFTCKEKRTQYTALQTATSFWCTIYFFVS